MSGPLCRSCSSPLEHTVIDFGFQPLSNGYLTEADVPGERTYPLHARFCGHCFLVQVDDVVAPDEIFSDYAYFSSYADTWVDHARRFVDAAADRFALNGSSLVVEVASNDGYLLQHVVERGIPALGIEPAANVADVAVARGVPTEVRFFGLEVANDLVARRGHADLVVANNVLAHVPDLNDFIAGLAALVGEHGVMSIEVPHLLELVERLEFDTIYHEHFSYFSLLALLWSFSRHGLTIFDVERLPTHGGSLRVFAASSLAAGAPSAEVKKIMNIEREASLDKPEGFASFAARSRACRDDLVGFLEDVRGEGKSVAAYGAAAKGNTLLNYAQVTTELLPYVVDRNPHKQGHLLPGSHLPIRDPAALVEDQPDYVLILPWNLSDEITEQMAVVRTWGGRFVVAVPELTVLP